MKKKIDVNSLYLLTSNFGTVKNGKFICGKFNVFITTYKTIGKDTIPTIKSEIIASFYCNFSLSLQVSIIMEL